jgi:hypothetical protein
VTLRVRNEGSLRGKNVGFGRWLDEDIKRVHDGESFSRPVPSVGCPMGPSCPPPSHLCGLGVNALAPHLLVSLDAAGGLHVQCF